MKITKSSQNGFTLMELVTTVAIMGIIAATAIPRYSQIKAKTKKHSNIANMNRIQETFFQYYYRQHMAGNPHFPTAPDSLMTDDWADTPIDSLISTLTPNDLFSSGSVPKNASNNPFYYSTSYETMEDGRKKHTIVIEDTDPTSPSHNQSFSYSI